MAELRTYLKPHRSLANRKYFLKLASLVPVFEEEHTVSGSLFTTPWTDANTIIDYLMQECLGRVDARPEKWRITNWPVSKEKHQKGKHRRRENTDRDKGKRSTVPPAASAAENGTQYLPSTTDEIETDADEINHTSDDSWIDEDKRVRQGLENKAKSRNLGERRRRKELERHEAKPRLEKGIIWFKFPTSPSPPLCSHGVPIQSTAPDPKPKNTPANSAAAAKPKRPFGPLEGRILGAFLT